MLGHVTYRTSRRAASVPIEPVRLMDAHGISSARRISNAARDDTDALMAESKRHDRDLLKDINTRLANQSFQAPPVGVIKRSSVTTTTSLRKPPLPPAGRSSTSVYSTVSAAAPRRSAASRYAADDDDVDFMPPTPVTKSVIRASSVPPRLPVVAPGSTRTTSYTVSQAGPYVTTSRQYLPSTTVNGPTATTWTIYSNGVNNDYNTIDNNLEQFGYVPTRVTNPPGQLGPVADLAIRQAHRNLDRIQKELKHNPETNGPATYRYLPKYYADLPSYDNVAVRRSAYHVTPVSATSGPVSSIRVRHASLSPLRGSGGSSYHRVVQSHRDTSPLRPSELISLFSSPIVSAPQTPVKIIEREITSNVSPKFESEIRERRAYRTSTEPPPSLPSLLTIAGASVTSAGRTPARRHTDLDFAPIPQPSTNVRPKMSETRRKVRDVLCKVKKDPHYFD